MTSVTRTPTPVSLSEARRLGAQYAVRKEPPPALNSQGVPCWTLALQHIYTAVKSPEFLLAAGYARNELGIARYDMPLRTDNGRDMRVDGLQEGLDGTAYTAGALREAESLYTHDSTQYRKLQQALTHFIRAAELLGECLCEVPPTSKAETPTYVQSGESSV